MQTLKDRFLYLGRHSERMDSSDRLLQSRIETLRQKGFLILENFIEPVVLGNLQKKIKTVLEESFEFETPSIAQSRIHPETHKKEIENYFLSTLKEWENLGITFSRSEMKSYDQILSEFQPSTLKWYVMKEELFAHLWLNKELLKIVESYMGLRPYLQEAYLRRNFPAKYRVMNHFWHRDRNHPDYLLKAFFFFTDCKLENGPHEYIAGSVQDRSLDGKPYYDDSEVDALYPVGSENRIQSIVKAGTVVIEDTRGLHRAMVPETGFRDLGFAVFLPKPFFKPWGTPLYKIDNTTFNSLDNIQKQYIPNKFIGN